MKEEPEEQQYPVGEQHGNDDKATVPLPPDYSMEAHQMMMHPHMYMSQDIPPQMFSTDMNGAVGFDPSLLQTMQPKVSFAVRGRASFLKTRILFR